MSCIFFFSMMRPPPRSIRTDTLCPFTTRVRALGVPGPALRPGCYAGSRPAAAFDAPGGGAVHSQAHAQPVRRGAVRALGREPVLPALLRRGREIGRAHV